MFVFVVFASFPSITPASIRAAAGPKNFRSSRSGIPFLFRSLSTSIATLAIVASVLPAKLSAAPLRGFTVSPGISDDDLDDLVTLRANVIRYHLQWDSTANTASSVEYLEWLDGALEKLDHVVEACRKRNISIIVNLHTPPGGFEDAKSPALHTLFVREWAYQTFLAAWTQIATRYKDENTIWGYDILNEPAQRPGRKPIKSWAKMAHETGTLINAIQRGKKIIIEPVYGNPGRLSTIGKVSVKGLVISPHLYFPWKFNHQGLFGIRNGIVYPKKTFNRAALVRSVRPILKLTAKRKVPIYIGEFTAIRWAPKGSAFRYLRDLTNILEQHKWNWTYHAFREADPWDLERSSSLNDLTRSSVDTDRMRLMKKRLAKNR